MASVARHSLVYAVGALLGKSIAFIMLPVYTRYLTPADYGVIALVEMALDVIVILAGAQLVLGVFRFYHRTSDAEEKNRIISTALIGIAFAHVVVGGFSFLAASRISQFMLGTSDYADVVRLAAAAMTFSALTIVPMSYMRLRDQSGLFVTATIVKLVIQLTLSITFVVAMRMGVKGVFTSTLIANVVVGVWLSWWTVREVGMKFSAGANRDLLRFGIPMIAVNFATFFMTFGGNYFLQSSADESVVGLYRLGYQFGFLLAVASSPFDMVWTPKRFEIAKLPDRDSLLARGFIYQNLILIPTACAIALFVDDLLRVMAAPAFWDAASVVPLVLIAYLFQGWGTQDIGILIREQTRLMWGIQWFSAIVAYLLFVTLIPPHKALGAAGAVTLTFALRWALIYLVSQRLWPVQYNWRPIWKLLVLTIGAVGIGHFLPASGLGWSLGLKGLIYLGFLCLVWNWDIIALSDKQEVRRLISKISARFA